MPDKLTLPRFLKGFHPRSLPLMARLSYQRELFSWGLLPLMLSGLQAGTIAIFLKKTFQGVEGVSTSQLDLAVSIVAASKAIGHIASFFWAGLSRGRPKIRFMVRLQLCTAVVVSAIAFAPRTSAGLWSVTALSILAWTLWSGVMTLRASVWRFNYARHFRPQIAGRLSTIDALLVAAAGMGIGFCLDLSPMTYHAIFPVLGLIGVVGALLYGRIPFRREQHHLAQERATQRGRTICVSPMVVARVLRTDKWYRGYMACMFAMGLGNLMLHPLLAISLTDEFNVGYRVGIAIATVIPLVCMSFAIPYWRRRLERHHVIEFRAVHSWVFFLVTSLVLAGTVLHQITFFYLASIALGMGWGGGVLAWNLGHQHFSPPDRDTEYMGVHITLTGVRGVLGPILGVQLYIYLSGTAWQPHALSTCYSACLLMNLIGALGFFWLRRKLVAHRNNDVSVQGERSGSGLASRELAASGVADPDATINLPKACTSKSS